MIDYEILLAGFGGGLLRGLVGFIKHQYTYKNVNFQLPYFLVMMFLSGVVGLLTGMIFNSSFIYSFIAGYAGGDFVENIYKTLARKPSLYDLSESLIKK